MKKEWIDNVITGIQLEVGSSDVYDILNYLNVRIIRDNEKQNPFLKKCDGIYIRNLFGEEVIIIKDNLYNEKFILAHELGHALLHIDYDFLMNNPVSLNNKKEIEADYFASKLLYSNVEIEEGIETKSHLAKFLGVNESVIDYIIDK